MLSDEVLDVVEQLIGPNIGLWSSHFICKDPFVGRKTPWHEDSSYWKGRVSNFDNIITVWLAIDDSNKENGCMQVIPGSHANGFSDYESVDGEKILFNTQFKDVDVSKAVHFELKRGECSLHDSRIIHGADANTSPNRLCGYTMPYFATNIESYPDKNPNFKVWLARGKDLAGNRYVNQK
ncbi:phytanoyl-CoA dioxygenase family protein [Paenibacillus swuensis]|uniref:phytanoyl-CoA dioxygenase family protein n=1 Tax=Paenibacillus swuensis TaxID=1178515 RepID=UPI000A66B77B|nr:phytanoyl-CoA dioxygenase family protein [Paenibacillus swuensis]